MQAGAGGDGPPEENASDPESCGSRKTGQPRSAFGSRALDVWVCQTNIARFRAELAATTDAHRRAVLSRLLQDQEALLRRLVGPADPDGEPVEERR